MIRIGQGFDVHQLVAGRPLILGGIEIPFAKGLLGHSDADVLLHTITDAALGALAMGDIGTHFPDTDPAFRDADSVELLRLIWQKVREQGYALGNLDATILAQKPKLAPYISQMQKNIAGILDVNIEQIGLKATTMEKLGPIGEERGIAAMSVILLVKDEA
jgi:2-C-methyl-D-erythritol 2,4-cyclodiphosphate synthase